MQFKGKSGYLATTITLEWDSPLEGEVAPHKYRICLSNAVPSRTVSGSSTTATLSDLSPETTYEITIAGERYGHCTLPSKVLVAATAIAPVRPATMYENQLLYFSCEDGNIQDIKYRLETCRHETAYDRHFVHDEAKGGDGHPWSSKVWTWTYLQIFIIKRLEAKTFSVCTQGR